MELCRTKKEIFDWCAGVRNRSRHFRVIFAIDEDKRGYCYECVSILLQNKKVFLRDEKKEKLRIKSKKKQKTIADKLLRRIRQILLSSDRPLLKDEIYYRVQDVSASYQALDLLLRKMRRQSLIAAYRMPPKGKIAYYLPERFLASPSPQRSDILRLLTSEEMTSTQIVGALGRPRSTVVSWLSTFLKEGIIESRLAPLDGKPGRYRLFKTNMMDASTQKLVQALEAIPDRLSDKEFLALLERVRNSDFHDYKSQSPTPIRDLVTALESLGLSEIALRAMQGDFDATIEESEIWRRAQTNLDFFAKIEDS